MKILNLNEYLIRNKLNNYACINEEKDFIRIWYDTFYIKIRKNNIVDKYTCFAVGEVKQNEMLHIVCLVNELNKTNDTKCVKIK